MKKQIMTAATTLALLTVAPAYAEFRVGVEAGSSSVSGELQSGGNHVLGGNESGGAIGVFGQYRFEASDTLDWGVHLGYSSESADVDAAYGTVTLAGVTYTDAVIEIEVESTYDLMGIIAWKGGKANPFIMAGYSTIQIDGSASGTNSGTRTTISDDDSASGWKVAIGVEFPLGESWSAHAVIDYADYGDLDFNSDSDLDLEFETEQTGIGIGISYRF